jgi:hypothetical protein
MASPVQMQRAAPDADASCQQDGSSLGRRLPSRINASSSIQQDGGQQPSKKSAAGAAKPPRHVSFNEFVHERIFALVPAAHNGMPPKGRVSLEAPVSASSDGSASEDGYSSSLDDAAVVVQRATPTLHSDAAAAQAQLRAASTALHSKLLLPPPPSPPESPRAHRDAAPPVISKFPPHEQPTRSSSISSSSSSSSSRSGGSRVANDSGNKTFESILTNISDGGATHARDFDDGGKSDAEGATGRELRLSHERMADNLLDRLLAISDRLSALSLLEACHPAGVPLPPLLLPCQANACRRCSRRARGASHRRARRAAAANAARLIPCVQQRKE